MKYHDFGTPSEQEYQLLKQNYIKMQAQENEDLQELLDKMNEQLTRLKGNNSDGKYDEIIAKLTSSINELASLITTNQSQFLRKMEKIKGKNMPPFRKIRQLDDKINNGETNSNSTIDNSNSSASNNNSPEDSTNTRSPIENISGADENSGADSTENSMDSRGDSENYGADNMHNNGDLDSSDNIDSDGDNANSDANKPNSGTLARQNTIKRNSPMPGNRLFNAFKSLNVNLHNNLNRLFGGNFCTKCNATTSNSALGKANFQTNKCDNRTQHMPSHPPFGNKTPIIGKCKPAPPCDNETPHKPPYPPFYKPPHEHDEHAQANKPPYPPADRWGDGCEFDEVCRHNQIDIIRLFLLYMMMRPTCRYLPTITAIANEQFDILIMLEA